MSLDANKSELNECVGPITPADRNRDPEGLMAHLFEDAVTGLTAKG